MKYLIKTSCFILMSLCFMGNLKAQEQDTKEDYTTTALVSFENVENPDCASENECNDKMFKAINSIPNVEFNDYDKKSNSVGLLITDKRITTASIIKGVINKSGVVKVKSILMPIPYKEEPLKDPYEGMSDDQIKKAYDDYYKENPDLKPVNW